MKTATKEWNHNLQYHEWVLRACPAPCASALDVGCGEGLLTRRLAAVCHKVMGIDLDEVFVATLSREEQPSNIRFVAGDVLTLTLPAEGFDFIAAVAVLHHLPLREALARFQSLLKPGGTLAVVGLYRAGTVTDYAWAAAAALVGGVLRRLLSYSEVQACKKRPEQTLEDLRLAAQTLLPGAVLKRRFFFRYSLMWRKPM